MNTSKLPTKAELDRIEAHEVGSASKAIQLHFESVRRAQDREDRKLDAAIKHQSHLRFYRYFSVASGCVLALSSLGLCAFSIQRNVDITPLSFILGPLVALSGVFVWGYRPTAQTDSLPSPGASEERELPRLPNNGGENPGAQYSQI